MDVSPGGACGSLADSGSAPMIFVNFSNFAPGVCAGGVAMAVATPCLTNLRTLLAKSADLSQRPRSLVKQTFNPEVGPGCRGVISGNKQPTPNSPTVSLRF